jgi:hypothetical protein
VSQRHARHVFSASDGIGDILRGACNDPMIQFCDGSALLTFIEYSRMSSIGRVGFLRNDRELHARHWR